MQTDDLNCISSIKWILGEYVTIIEYQHRIKEIVGKTIMNDSNDSTVLIIPKEISKELDIGNSKVSMTLLEDSYGDRHLLATKYHKEIVID